MATLEQSSINRVISTGNPTSGGTPNRAATIGATGNFVNRFTFLLDVKDKEVQIPISSAKRACRPSQAIDAYGFYTQKEKPPEPSDKVDFGVYSRVLYYSLAPGPLGNLPIPKNWQKVKEKVKGKESPTKGAHAHGSAVDLVISKEAFEFTKERDQDDKTSKNGLRLSKSFVVLNMIDEIVEAVEDYGFDGVVIDFRLPANQATQETFVFFISRLKARLTRLDGTGRTNDLLKPSERLLSVVIDDTLLKKLNVGYLKNNDLKNNDLNDVMSQTLDSVDFWLVADVDLQHTIKQGLVKGNKKNSIVILSNKEPLNENVLGKAPVVVWDVAGTQGAKWSGFLHKAIKTDRKHTISTQICTKRTTILGALSGITPLLVVMLVLSWLISDLPKFIKKYKPTMVLWGLLAIVSVVFVVLIYSLPSLDLKHNGVYVILASLAIPLGYIVWQGLSRLSKTDYP
ncbi:MAG: hypothetical protein IIA92_02950 [Chloroflexi bacterium]|nr:hypothetical protein [Chloroflexota bacterium]